LQAYNSARGEITATLGGREVRLCVTLGALAQLESHFKVAGFEALSERMKTITPDDLAPMLSALSLEPEPIAFERVGVAEGLHAVLAAFEALNDG
jgi:hypothetical protein